MNYNHELTERLNSIGITQHREDSNSGVVITDAAVIQTENFNKVSCEHEAILVFKNRYVAEKYQSRVIDNELRIISNAQESNRNNTLSLSAGKILRVHQTINSDKTDELETMIYKAASSTGLPSDEIIQTINSAKRYAQENPKPIFIISETDTQSVLTNIENKLQNKILTENQQQVLKNNFELLFMKANEGYEDETAVRNKIITICLSQGILMEQIEALLKSAARSAKDKLKKIERNSILLFLHSAMSVLFEFRYNIISRRYEYCRLDIPSDFQILEDRALNTIYTELKEIVSDISFNKMIC
jgi:hypothetical protein